jgi:hypothetical protein
MMVLSLPESHGLATMVAYYKVHCVEIKKTLEVIMRTQKGYDTKDESCPFSIIKPKLVSINNNNG